MKKIVMISLISIFSCVAMEQDNQIEWSSWDVALYDQASKPQDDATYKKLQETDLSAEKFRTIVELNCRLAKVSGELSKKYPNKRFIGIDSNPNFIDDAKKKHSDKTNLHLECAWPESFKLEKPANFMLCHHLLHWLSPKEFPAVFKNIAANLQEGGVLDISSSAKQEDSSLTKAILKTLAKPKWWRFLPASCWQVIKGQGALTLLTIEELKELSANAGLKVEKCEEVEECASFDSKDQFALWIQLSLTPWGIDSIMKTQEAQKEFVADVADLFCKQYNASSDKIEYRFKGLHLLAHKK